MRSISLIAGQIADELAAAGMERIQRLRSHLLDLRNYLVSNQGGLTNYAQAYRPGLGISSAPAESMFASANRLVTNAIRNLPSSKIFEALTLRASAAER